MSVRRKFTASDTIFALTLLLSALLGVFGWIAPQRQMPLDFYRMLRISLPLAFAWVVLFGLALYRFRKKAFWLLLTAPMALYWPTWLLIFGLPSCYYNGNCV